jgi:putative phosphoesterase
LKILALSDIHGDIKTVQLLAHTVNDCDVIVVAGDITDFGGTEQADAVLSELGTLGLPVLAVTGNCDAPQVADVLLRNSSLLDHAVKLDGVLFVGFGHPVGQMADLPNEPILDRSKLPVVLVTHEPAWNTDLDLQGSSRHRGSRAVRSWIESHQPALAVSGHIHEAFGIDQIGSTMLVNPGPLRNGRYAIVELYENTARAKLYWIGQ